MMPLLLILNITSKGSKINPAINNENYSKKPRYMAMDEKRKAVEFLIICPLDIFNEYPTIAVGYIFSTKLLLSGKFLTFNKTFHLLFFSNLVNEKKASESSPHWP